MRPIVHILIFLFLLAIISDCKKTILNNPKNVFVKLFPFDTSYQSMGSFQLADGNFILYGASPEDNGSPPILLKIDKYGTILRKKNLPGTFHFCTVVPTSNGFIVAGTEYSLSSTLNLCYLNDDMDIVGIVNQYSYDQIRSGPLMTPRIEPGNGGDLNIALTAAINNGNGYAPLIIHINAAGTADQIKTYSLGSDLKFMVRGFEKDDHGFTVMGSTYISFLADTTHLKSFCLRLDENFHTQWDTTFTISGGSISTSCLIYSSPSIIFLGSYGPGTYPNNSISDFVGRLYARRLDSLGAQKDSMDYSKYENFAHISAISKTTDGFIVAATTNELFDYHLLSATRIYLLKLDNDLNEQWHRQFNGYNPFDATSVAQTSDGGYLISGFEQSDTFHNTMCLIKTDANGDVVQQ